MQTKILFWYKFRWLKKKNNIYLNVESKGLNETKKEKKIITLYYLFNSIIECNKPYKF